MKLVTIILMCILSGAEVDLFVPSFPNLQHSFNLSPSLVVLTLGVNFCAYCVGAIFAGEWGDRFGRRPLILYGLLVFIVGSILCVWAPNFTTLLVGRFLQGLGISCPAVLAYVVVSDEFPIEKQQKIMGVLNGIITLAMAFAPVVGSYVNNYFGWQGNFTALLVLGLLCFVMGFIWIHDHHHKPSVEIAVSYKTLFHSSRAWAYAGIVCLMVIPYWIFIGISPILYMTGYGVSLKEFGLYQGALSVMFSLVSLSSGRFLTRYGQATCFHTSMILCAIATALIGTTAILNINDPMIITPVLMILSVSVVIPVNILYPLSLEAVVGAKGRMAAVVLSSRLIFTALGLQLAGYMYQQSPGTFKPIAGIMCTCLILSFFLLRWMLKKEMVPLKE